MFRKIRPEGYLGVAARLFFNTHIDDMFAFCPTSGEGEKAAESPRFLNLPLKETGRRFLQCVVWTEAGASRRLRR